MATLTLFKPTTSNFDSYNGGNNYDLTPTSWYLFNDTEKVVYGALFGSNLTYDDHKNPILGTITSVNSFDKYGHLQWTLSGIAVASNSVNSLETMLTEGEPFDRHSYMVNTFLKSNDTIMGSPGNDIIPISDGVDSINGGKGSDWLDFSERSSYYQRKLTVDLVAGEYSVTDNGIKETQGHFKNIENVIGWSGDDMLIGDTKNNLFNSSPGNDVINGGGEGVDTVSYRNAISVNVNLLKEIASNVLVYPWSTTTYTDTLINIENIIGSTGNDTIIGNALNNQLTGDLGDDILDGGMGIDTANYSNSYRAVTVNLTAGEAKGQGTDKLANIENVLGTYYNDVLVGSRFANLLKGSNGNDSLNGRAGNDTLLGGLGHDKFIFNTATKANIDRLPDFSVVDDTIQLENSIFSKLHTTGTLNNAYFKIAKSAVDSNDYIIYNKTNGGLFYDADGNGLQPAVQIAKLGVNLALTHADFVIT